MKRRYLAGLLISFFLLSACTAKVDPKEHISEVYNAALDSLMEQDHALNSDMRYIAIDMSHFKETNENDKKSILRFFKDKYKVDVMEATFEQLKEKGLYDPEKMALDGVLLKIEKVDYKFNNTVWLEGTKYRSSLGAVSAEMTVHYVDGQWKAKETKVTTIN